MIQIGVNYKTLGEIPARTSCQNRSARPTASQLSLTIVHWKLTKYIVFMSIFLFRLCNTDKTDIVIETSWNAETS